MVCVARERITENGYLNGDGFGMGWYPLDSQSDGNHHIPCVFKRYVCVYVCMPLADCFTIFLCVMDGWMCIDRPVLRHITLLHIESGGGMRVVRRMAWSFMFYHHSFKYNIIILLVVWHLHGTMRTYYV